MSPPDLPRLYAAAATQLAFPHLAGFFPDFVLTAAPDAPVRLVFDRRPPPRGAAWRPPANWLAATEAPLRAPRFGRRHAPVALVVMNVASPGVAAAAGAFAVGGVVPPELANCLRDARVGGQPDLPDPGAARLGLPRGEAVVVLDPGRGPRKPRQAMLDAAARTAAGRPVFCALAPDAPVTAADRLPPPPGGVSLPAALAPWTLLDLAAELHGMGDATELVAAAIGLPVCNHAPDAHGGLSPIAAMAALCSATRCADPFRDRPSTLEAAIRQLADWRVAGAENRRIVAATGIEWFKARSLRQALAASASPRLFARGSAALRHARAHAGTAAVWAAVMPDALPARAAASGVDLVRLEDGFLRSAGLGVALAPALSLVRDTGGIHYDPTTPSDLERLLSSLQPDAALLARAAALRNALRAGAVTKYRPSGPAATIVAPAARRVILVVGQVEGDASLRRGGQRLSTNAGLLAAARAGEPAAFLVFKPHPDVAAGMRRGAIEARGVADQVVDAAPIADLYAQADAVHTISSLAGFEALLRGVPVTTWGRPFYAGWGLTEDRDPLPPGPLLPGAIRSRWAPEDGDRLTLLSLIAAALILYPRYVDPRSRLPCPVEVVVERLAMAPVAASKPRIPVALRALTGRVSRYLAGWWAAR